MGNSQRLRFPKYCLEDLVAQMLDNYNAKEADWNEPTGKEVW